MTDAEKLKIAIDFIRDLSERGGNTHCDGEWEAGYEVAVDCAADEAAAVLARIA